MTNAHCRHRHRRLDGRWNSNFHMCSFFSIPRRNQINVPFHHFEVLRESRIAGTSFHCADMPGVWNPGTHTWAWARTTNVVSC